jgi:hypothetical protein
MHDYLYRVDSKPEVKKETADALFLEAMQSRGVSWLIRWPMYEAVSMFGGPSYHRMKVGELYELDAER